MPSYYDMTAKELQKLQAVSSDLHYKNGTAETRALLEKVEDALEDKGYYAEMCPHCEGEVYIKPMMDKCPECGREILACAQCPWEEGHGCTPCPYELLKIEPVR